MPKKNATKVAARARQQQFGGKLSHHRHVVTGGGGPEGPDDNEQLGPQPMVLEDPRYPEDDFDGRVGDESDDVKDLLRWFFRRYEDPVHGVYHDSSEGGYQYAFGGPSDALDVLGNQFGGQVADADIERAVRIIQDYDGTAWVETRPLLTNT